MAYPSSIDAAVGDALEHLESLTPLVGNTPLAAIDFIFRGACVYANSSAGTETRISAAVTIA